MKQTIGLEILLASCLLAAAAWMAPAAMAADGAAPAATATPTVPEATATPTAPAAPAATATPTVPEATATPIVPEATATPTAAAPAAEAPAGYMDALDEFIAKSKAPFPWLVWGADLRVRDEYSHSLNLNSEAPRAAKDEQNWLRYRTRIWSTITPAKDVNLNMRLVWEGWRDFSPDNAAGFVQATGSDGYRKKEVLFDAMNLQLNNIGGMPINATLGRQDIILGDGWLILEGTPGDGSRTIFFDAARFTFNLKDSNTTVDAIYIQQNYRGSTVMPPLLHYDPRTAKAYVIEQDERGVILWVANKSLKNTEIDGFYIYKDMDAQIGGPAFARGYDGHIHTTGARLVEDFDTHWQLKAQGAHQWGQIDGRDLSSYGFVSKLSYFTRDAMNNNFRVGYEFLSGDDPGSAGRNEAWQPLWGRWPQWSELYIFTVVYTGESHIAEINNIHRLGFGWSFNPSKNVEVAADYHLLFTDENTKGTTAGFTENGAFRGELLTVCEKFTICKHLSGHLLQEFFFPGNYYTAPNNSTATFLRGELVFSW